MNRIGDFQQAALLGNAREDGRDALLRGSNVLNRPASGITADYPLIVAAFFDLLLDATGLNVIWVPVALRNDSAATAIRFASAWT